MAKPVWRFWLLLGIVAMATAVAPAAVVQELAPMNEARAEPGVTVLDGQLWVFGGEYYDVPAVTLSSVEVYDPTTDMWTTKASMPEPRVSPAAVACTSGPYAGMIFAFGGHIAGGGNPKFRNTWMYDPGLDTWTSGLAEIPGDYHDDGRTAAVAVFVDGEIWLIGGYDGMTPQERRVDVYDPATDTWRDGPWLNYPLQMDGVSQYGGLLYALQTVDRGGVEVCDPSAAIPGWTEISTSTHQWPPWGLVGNEVFGLDGDPSEIVSYDILTNSWRSEGSLPGGYCVEETIARTIGDTVYIPGGTCGAPGLDRLLAFTPKEPVWPPVDDFESYPAPAGPPWEPIHCKPGWTSNDSFDGTGWIVTDDGADPAGHKYLRFWPSPWPGTYGFDSNYAKFHLRSPETITDAALTIDYIVQSNADLQVMISGDNSSWTEVTHLLDLDHFDSGPFRRAEADLTALLGTAGIQTDAYVMLRAAAHSDTNWVVGIDHIEMLANQLTTMVDLVAFDSDRSGNLDIWTMHGDGANLQQWTTDPAEDSEPDWSPDGGMIAFTSLRSGNADIWVLDTYTLNTWQITSGPAEDRSATWSPDGDRIAFVSDAGITGEVYVVDVSDLSHPGVPSKLTTYDPGDADLEGEIEPDWCVNGYVAYQAERNHAWLWSIWATNPDNPSDEYEAVPYFGGAGAYYPAWSPTGGAMAYSDMQSGSPSAHNDDIYLLRNAKSASGPSVAVTSDSVIGNTGVGDAHPAWSPLGRRIYFARVDYDTGARDIFAVNRDGSGLVNLTNRADGSDSHPSVIQTSGCQVVRIDVKPGSSRNPVNPRSQGVIPVAVFSSASFDATDIDPSTVALAGASVALHAGESTYMMSEKDEDLDGLMDVLLHFDTETFDADLLATGYAVMVGSTNAGSCFEGWDVVTVVPPDLANNHWSLDDIAKCMKKNIVKGYPDGLYRPNVVVSRDQMAVFVSRAAAGGDAAVPPGPEQPSFPDVPVDQWAYDYIEYATGNDIVEGYSNGTYQPEWAVTRGQMAVFIARAVVTPPGDEGLAGYEPPIIPTFSDVPDSYWSYAYIEYLAGEGIVRGYADGRYRPAQRVTRDQMCAYIARAFELE